MISASVLFPIGGTGWISHVSFILFGLLQIRLGYFLLSVAYRLSPLHPLYAFPGPALARATYLYEMYFDLIKGGKYTHEIKRLHDIYGPLIRVNPGGLHCNDPYFVDEVYAGGTRKRNKAFLHINSLVGPYEPPTAPLPPYSRGPGLPK